MQETRGHKDTQPGLRGHSHDPEQDLMKRYVVAKVLPTGGKLWLRSFNEWSEAQATVPFGTQAANYVIIDQFAK